TVLPFHRVIVRDPAFTSSPFSVYTRWIETEFDNELEPWSGELEDVAPAAERRKVTVEVDGKRIEVSLPGRVAGSSSKGPALTAPPRRNSGSRVLGGATGDAVK